MSKRAAAGGDDTLVCPGCRAPLIRQLVGHTAALTVTADLRPLTPEQQARARGPNRLIWCLIRRPHVPARLRWIDRWHPPDCPHPHLADHQCPPSTPSTLF